MPLWVDGDCFSTFTIEYNCAEFLDSQGVLKSPVKTVGEAEER